MNFLQATPEPQRSALATGQASYKLTAVLKWLWKHAVVVALCISLVNFGFQFANLRYVGAATTVVFLTSGTSYTVPADWNSSNNTIEVIGGGGAGGDEATGTAGTANTGGGGGGGGNTSNGTSYAGGAGGSGIVIVSYTPVAAFGGFVFEF